MFNSQNNRLEVLYKTPQIWPAFFGNRKVSEALSEPFRIEESDRRAAQLAGAQEKVASKSSFLKSLER